MAGPERINPIHRSFALRIAAFYGFIGSLWIVISDVVVFLGGSEPLFPTVMSIAKGEFFILVTGTVLYLYMTRWNHAGWLERQMLTQRLTQLSRYANDIILLIDGNGRLIDANDRAVAAYGYPAARLLELSVGDLRADPAPRDWREDWRVVLGKGDVRFEAVHRRSDGSVFPVEVSSRRIDRDGTYVVQSIIRDISERKEAERQILHLRDVYAALSQTNQCIVRVSDRRELFATICRIAVKFGHFRMAWIGLLDERTRAIVPVESAGTGTEALVGVKTSADPASPYSRGASGHAVITGKHFICGEIAADPDQTPWHAWATGHGFRSVAAFPLFFRSGTIGALVLYSEESAFFTPELTNLLDEMAMDISFALDRMEADANLEFLSHHDSLTGLPNRLLGRDRMEMAMLAADRRGCKAALLVLDIDHFKKVNESLGHAVGDLLLKAVAERLRGCFRETDTISRQGGDEFLIVVTEIADAEAVNRLAAAVFEKMDAAIAIGGRELAATVSIGAALYPDDGGDFEALFRHADTAMRHAKDAGRNSLRFFDERMNVDAREYLDIFNGLRRALDRGEFSLDYQPQVCLDSGRLAGAEALIRWKPPGSEPLCPARFIPVAEESGLIVEIGDWVLCEACRRAAAWQDGTGHGIGIAVNISAIQFRRGRLTESVRRALEESGLKPSCLELEMTESSIIGNTDAVLRTVDGIRRLGVRLSIDDFGTGYSNLSYLKRFDIGKLKIDRSFIGDILDNPDNQAIVGAMIQLAHGLGIRTVAEGVEDRETLEVVRRFGCDEVQGYYFARPMSAEALSDCIARGLPFPQATGIQR